MRVTNITVTESPDNPDCRRASALVCYADRPDAKETVWFDMPADIGGDLSTTADPWVAVLLPLACKLGEDLHVDAPLDGTLRDGMAQLMEWWRFWFPFMHLVSIHASGTFAGGGGGARRSAQFFSGGVDSFFTLLRHSGQHGSAVDDLLVGWGFDIPLAERTAFENVRQSLSRVAHESDKRLIAFATNLRQTRFGHDIPWGTIGHGSAMAAVALLAARIYHRVFIPSTDGYRESGPWGSHATTDHFYSCSGMRVIHDGAAYSRLQKVQLIAPSPVALAALRVCWRGQSDRNCGKCEKCLRTMIALELCNGLQAATTFPDRRLDYATIRRIYCPHQKEGSLQLYYRELYDEARRQQRRQLARTLTSAMRRSTRYRLALYCIDRLNFVPAVGIAARRLGARLRSSLII